MHRGIARSDGTIRWEWGGIGGLRAQGQGGGDEARRCIGGGWGSTGIRGEGEGREREA